MKLIVGLGNPGQEYQNTRHNVGFMFLDYYASVKQLDHFKEKFNGAFCQTTLNHEKVILFKPYSYMNLSGEPIVEVMQYFHISLADLLVVYDDMDLPFCSLRLRMKGNAGGHNGMKNILLKLNSNEFSRIRIGIDRPKDGKQIDYVLSSFSKEDIFNLQNVFKKVAAAVDEFIVNNFAHAMNLYNVKMEKKDE